MTDVVICEPVRTPVGAFHGVFAGLSAADLATSILTALVKRTGLGEGDVDDVILGQCYANGESPAIGRLAGLDAGLGTGLGTGVPGMQVDRRCGSGLQAVLNAAMQVGSGAAELVIAGGVESMSQVEHYALGLRTGVKGDGVELMDRLARGRVTAGCIPCPSWAVAGVGPEVMGIGPVPAVAAARDRAGLTLADMDLIELNEAFASQVIACLREWKFSDADHERLNVNGSGISLGHPVGATGGRILATLAHEMRRRSSRYGLETMCIGGGQGLAAVFEAV